MPRPCVTCHHPNRQAIDLELVSGTPRMAVARRWGLSETAVRRHFRLHLPERLRIEDEAARRVENAELSEMLRLAVRDVGRQVEQARDLRRPKALRRAWNLFVPLAQLQSRALSDR